MGSPRVSPPRAPECPLSGLSLTTAMSCPRLPLGLEFRSSPGRFCYPELRSHPEVPHLPSAPKGSDLGVPTFRKGADAALASRGHPGEAGKALGWRCRARAWGSFWPPATMQYENPISSSGAALLVGGGVRGQATPPCNSAQVSPGQPLASKLLGQDCSSSLV